MMQDEYCNLSPIVGSYEELVYKLREAKEINFFLINEV